MKTVFFDVDTQIDFLFPSGALYVPGAEKIVPVVSALNHHAASNGILVVSDMDAHAENDPEFRHWPSHCVAGTLGQRKPQETLLEKRVLIPSTPGAYPIGDAQQVLLEKQTLDCFSNPNLTALLDELNADRYVVYGVVTEICVRCAAFGLLKTGKPVELVTDAVRSLDDAKAKQMMEEFTAAGGHLITANQIIQ
ncbi:MAG: cysteine hydrolase family protein [Acidimicrobiia bacterium]|nr:cysteine hydrolase family protein [Acidimicrobiia bacterium]